MHAAAKRSWVSALRSGNWQQGFGCLYDERTNTYDAWGVFLRVVHTTRQEDRTFYYYRSIKPMTTRLNPKILEGYELTDADVLAIINLNDRRRLTFPQIAEWIEQNL